MRCTPGDRCTLGSADLSGRESYERNQSDGPVLRVIRATAAKGGRTFEEEAEDTSPNAAGKAKLGEQEIVADPSGYATASNLIHQEERANIHGLKDRVTCGVYRRILLSRSVDERRGRGAQARSMSISTVALLIPLVFQGVRMDTIRATDQCCELSARPKPKRKKPSKKKHRIRAQIRSGKPTWRTGSRRESARAFQCCRSWRSLHP